jgi:hypothetical protein
MFGLRDCFGTVACASFGHARIVTVERLDPRVVALVRAATDRRSSYAEIWRRVRPRLERRGLAVPSYDTVRLLVREERARRAPPPEPGSGVIVEPFAGRVTIRDWQ